MLETLYIGLYSLSLAQDVYVFHSQSVEAAATELVATLQADLERTRSLLNVMLVRLSF